MSGSDPVAPRTDVVQRKRGAVLEYAILAAAYDELCEVGYAAFTVEQVAARAGTGKASIYRRWPTRQELLLDALSAGLPMPAQCGLEPVLNDSVTTADALRGIAAEIGRVLTSPAGAAMRAVKYEAASNPELAQLVDERFQAPRRSALLGLLRRGVTRGEVRADAVSDLVADVLPAMLLHQLLLQPESDSGPDITAIVEKIVIPLVAVH